MFVNRQQHINAKYGRDQCITCLRKLGFGGDLLARTLACGKSTLMTIIQNRITEPRYTGFDALWVEQRAQNRKLRPNQRNHAPQDYVKVRLQDIISFSKQEARYNALYFTRYAYQINSTTNPDFIEHKRRGFYRRQGVAEKDIPSAGTYRAETTLSAAAQKEIKRIRRRRNVIREKVREVWKGQVGDRCAIFRVGCTVHEFQSYVRMLMSPTWTDSNYGKVWNFDHIVPCVAFNVFDGREVKRLNHYTNLRPCCAMENSMKSGSC